MSAPQFVWLPIDPVGLPDQTFVRVELAFVGDPDPPLHRLHRGWVERTQLEHTFRLHGWRRGPVVVPPRANFEALIPIVLEAAPELPGWWRIRPEDGHGVEPSEDLHLEVNNVSGGPAHFAFARYRRSIVMEVS